MSDDFIAANIVFQIGDLLEAPVKKRQETNGRAIAFVNRLLKKHTAIELRCQANSVRTLPQGHGGITSVIEADLRRRADVLWREYMDVQ